MDAQNKAGRHRRMVRGLFPQTETGENKTNMLLVVVISAQVVASDDENDDDFRPTGGGVSRETPGAMLESRSRTSMPGCGPDGWHGVTATAGSLCMLTPHAAPPAV